MSYQHQYVDGTHIHFPMGKVVCIGRNYAEHAKELNNPVPTEPLLFIKAGSCVVPLDDGFTLVEGKGDVHYEAEIAVLIGKPLSRTPSAEEVRDAISGFAPALDLTLRDLQATLKAKGYPWETAKSFDGACVLAPFVPSDAVEDLADLGIRLSLNGELRQESSTAHWVRDIPQLIAEISEFMTLYPGDVLITGTPQGRVDVQPGDQVEVDITGIGRLSNTIAAEASA